MGEVISAVSGISGTVRWSIDCDGLMLFEPLEGKIGALESTYSFEREWENYAHLIKQVKAIGTIQLPKNSSWLFYGCANLDDIDLSHFDTSKVRDMSSMFKDCTSLEYIDLSNFDTSNVFNMGGMFQECYSLEELDLSSFDTSNVTNMNNMFNNCRALKKLNLLSFKTHKVENMANMFRYCRSLKNIDLSNFDMLSVIDMESMFECCFNLEHLNLSKFDFCNKPNVVDIIDGCNMLKDFVVADKLEKKCKQLVFFYEFSNNLSTAMFFVDKVKLMRLLLTNIEELTGWNFSEERRNLDVIKATDTNDLTEWKAQYYVNNNEVEGRLFDILKIIAAYDIDIKKLAETSVAGTTKMLKENGVMSDINAYVKGVPLEDILA